jgi:hypothetical protein
VETLSLQVQVVGVLLEEDVVEEISMKDLVETLVDMRVLLSGSEIDEVF